MRRPTASRFLSRLARRLLVPGGLAAAVGLASLSPAVPPAPSAVAAEVAPAVRTITPGKRRDEVVDVYERVKAAVVNIHSERTVPGTPDGFSTSAVRPQQVNGMGTGIVLDPRGYVLTNFHVVDDVTALRVRLHDGAGMPARVLGTDKEADLALIKIDPARPLPVMPFGTSADLMVGEAVIAIGNAYGYEHTVTHGRVSFKGRDVSLNKDTGYKGLIQTSAPINPGNSGGPLLNVLGELVGVNVAIRAGAQNIGFALPIDFVVGRAADLVSRRRSGIRHGLVLRDGAVRGETEGPARRAVTVEAVEGGSPAAAAGFRAGDVVERAGDVPVVTSIDWERSLLEKPAGAAVPVKVARGSESADLELVLEAARPMPAAPADVVWRRLGLRVQPAAAEVVKRAEPALRGGLLVTEVAVGGAAAGAGVRKGDVLVGLHTWETLRVEDAAFVLGHADYAGFLPLKYVLIRDGAIQKGHFGGSP